tara:strand:+ start:12495 stop:13301 length:807 start_codon:yes stop_codon:yes gene_type:complete
MAFIKYEDCIVNLNDKVVFANRAQLSASAKIEPSRNMLGELIRYSPTGPIEGSLDLSFYLTKNFQNNHQEFNILDIINSPEHLDAFSSGITGSIAGVSFTNAYLNNFNFSVEPFSPVLINANFSIFGALSASSNQSEGFSHLGRQEGQPANGVNSFYTAATELGVDHPISFSYQASINRMINLEIGESIPTRAYKGNCSATVNINSEGFGNSLKINGNEAALTAHLYPLYSTDPVGSFYCSGQLISQTLSTSSSDLLRGSLTIEQSLR